MGCGAVGVSAATAAARASMAARSHARVSLCTVLRPRVGRCWLCWWGGCGSWCRAAVAAGCVAGALWLVPLVVVVACVLICGVRAAASRAARRARLSATCAAAVAPFVLSNCALNLACAIASRLCLLAGSQFPDPSSPLSVSSLLPGPLLPAVECAESESDTHVA